MNINEEVGQRIKNRRIEIGMTQFELAQKLGYSGKSMISLIEAGKRPLYVWQIAPLCVALDCTIEDLIDKELSEKEELIDFVETLTPEQARKALSILRVTFGGDEVEVTK